MQCRVVFVIVLVLSFPLFAQERPERCRATDTPRECFERWVAVPVKNPEAPAAQAVKTLLLSVNDGTSDLNAPVHATLKDFLTVLSASLDSAVVGDDATGLSFGYTPPVDVGGHLRFETKFTKPKLSAQTLSIVTGAAAQKQLEDSLTALDDVTYALSFDWTTRRFGRSVERHLPLLAALVPPPADAQARFERLLAANGIAAADAEKSFRQLNLNVTEFESALRSATLPSQIENDFASLLNNQPQVYVTGFYNARRDVVGPSRRGGELTLELAGRNLNGFYRYEGRNCGDACAEALGAYLTRIRDPRNAPRVALAVAYEEVESTELAGLPPTEKVRSLVYSLSAGVPFASLVGGKEGRLELGVKYDGEKITGELVRNGLLRSQAADFEEFSLAPPRQRLVTALSYTQAISDNLSIPVSFVYSDVEYTLPTAGAAQRLVSDHESAVHVGLRYRMGPTRPIPRCGC